MGRVVDSLGKRPFHIRRGINVAAFDSVMVAFADGREIPTDIEGRYQALKEDKDFIEATTSGTTAQGMVRQRLELARRILFG